MVDFVLHTKDTVSLNSRKLLEDAEKNFGFIPNLLRVLAESPAALEGFLQLARAFESTSFSGTERQVAILAISRFNECDYCIAAHSVAARGLKVPSDVIDSIRDDRPIEEPRLETLRRFATQVVDKRGWVSSADVAAFLGAGFTQEQVLEVILAASLKTLTNYVDHLAKTPLDDVYVSQAWQPTREVEQAIS